jgi:uncharacterized protein YhbP (UPF0306 family)
MKMLIPKEVFECVEAQRTGVLAVKMIDGTPHAATVHFAYKADPFTFIFLTTPTYRKLEPLRVGETPASFVIGTTEEFNKTLQMDGVAKLEDSEELRKIYFEKFPHKLNKHPEDVFFVFTPTWWRFTDWTVPQGKTIWLSDGSVTVKKKV